MHQLTPEINGVDKKTLCEAKVWVNSRLNFKELQEFKSVGDDASITTSPILATNNDWKLEGVTRESNVPAFKLASRVTQEHRFQSYGSWGDPVWLRRILEEEQKRCYLPGNC